MYIIKSDDMKSARFNDLSVKISFPFQFRIHALYTFKPTWDTISSEPCFGIHPYVNCSPVRLFCLEPLVQSNQSWHQAFLHKRASNVTNIIILRTPSINIRILVSDVNLSSKKMEWVSLHHCNRNVIFRKASCVSLIKARVL